MKLRERVIYLSARIAALRSEIDGKRTELVKMERELDSLLTERPETSLFADTATTTTTSTSTTTTAIPNGNHASIAARIGKLLSEYPGQEFNAETIRLMLEDADRAMPNLPSIRAALSRLADEETIERPKRGLYRAKTLAA
jgi:hypothetical protein